MDNLIKETKSYEDQISDKSDVTVVITACKRPDLLLLTLNSFFKFNTYPVKKVIITEDSGILDINKEVKKEYPNLTYIEDSVNVGQIRSIDRAYAIVDTPFIFHLEEDWEFYQSGFIELSLEILKTKPRVSAVMCIEHCFRYRPDPNNPKFLVCGNPKWGYYSFNPGLRRLSDYKTLCNGAFGNFTTWNRNRPVRSEKTINDLFRSKGFRMAILPDPKGYVKHIGYGRHVL